jgi:hypothetical protein
VDECLEVAPAESEMFEWIEAQLTKASAAIHTAGA